MSNVYPIYAETWGGDGSNSLDREVLWEEEPVLEKTQRLHIFSSTLENCIVSATHHENEVLDGVRYNYEHVQKNNYALCFYFQHEHFNSYRVSPNQSDKRARVSMIMSSFLE